MQVFYMMFFKLKSQILNDTYALKFYGQNNSKPQFSRSLPQCHVLTLKQDPSKDFRCFVKRSQSVQLIIYII